MEVKSDKARKRKVRRFRRLGVLLFAIVMALGFAVGCLFFLRPTVSELEKRELTSFPEFTAASFWDGSFFSQLSLWFSDTYPMRESMVAADQNVKSLYGIEPDTMMVGVQGKADEIPEINRVQLAAGATNEVETEESPDPAGTAPSEEPSDAAEDGTVRQVQPPDVQAMDVEFQNQVQQSLYVKDGAAYSMYYFIQDSATTYINALNRAAQELSGEADVYCILIPNQSGVMLSDEDLESFGGSDQTQAIDYYYSMLEGVKTVDTIRTLREHNDEYLYFRTDHHWTQLGAYYVYKNFCEVKGIDHYPLVARGMYTFDNFLGTFYSTLNNAAMAENPDTVYAYRPKGTNDMVFWDADGTEYNWSVIRDVSKWAQSSYYMTFIGGDRPLSIIENPAITDGSSCLVLKESYGNCFVPLLVDHYQTVYVMDYRYAELNALDYVRQNQIDDLILINNITIIGSGGAVKAIDNLLS